MNENMTTEKSTTEESKRAQGMAGMFTLVHNQKNNSPSQKAVYAQG